MLNRRDWIKLGLQEEPRECRGLGVYDSNDTKIDHMNVLTIGKELTGQWVALEGLAKPDDIVQTVLSLTATHSAPHTPIKRHIDLDRIPPLHAYSSHKFVCQDASRGTRGQIATSRRTAK